MNIKQFLFIDESGSPDFYGKRKRPLWLEDNFSPVLLMGLLATPHRKKLRKTVQAFQEKILADPLYNSIYSVRQPNWFLHAKDDHPEIRIQFFELIRQLDFIDCHIILARKIPQLFHTKHNSNAKEFYFDVLYNMLQQFPFEQKQHYQLYLSRRDSTNSNPFSDAINKTISRLTKDGSTPFCTYNCDVVKANQYPELSVLDYLLWAVQRYILKRERRFLTALEGKFNLIYDVYDLNAENRFYNIKNPFLLEKASSFTKKNEY